MANYTTEFLSVYIKKNAQTIRPELTLVGKLFGQLDIHNTIKGFNWELDHQIGTMIEYDDARTMDHNELNAAYPLLPDNLIDVLVANRNDILELDQWYDSLCIPDKSTLPRQTPDAAINRVEALSGSTHLNLAISRKRDASRLMDHVVSILLNLFGDTISLMRRVALDEAKPFSTENAITITPEKRSHDTMTNKNGQPVSIDFYNAHGDYAGRGDAIIFHEDDDDNLDPFLQDIINTQDRLEAGWQRDHTIVVESVKNENRDAFYHHVMRLFTPEQMNHLHKQ